MYRKGTTLIWSSRNHGSHGNVTDNHHGEGGQSSKSEPVGDGGGDSVSDMDGTSLQTCSASLQTDVALSTTVCKGNTTASVSNEHSPMQSGREGGEVCNETSSKETTKPQLSMINSSDCERSSMTRDKAGIHEVKEDKREKGGDRGSKDCHGHSSESRPRRTILVLHCDIIGDSFWEEHPNIIVIDSS